MSYTILQLIPLVEKNYERLTTARQTYTNLYCTYEAIKGNDQERMEFIRRLLCDVGKEKPRESLSLNHVLAILIPTIFSHPSSNEDLLSSMKAMKISLLQGKQ